MLHSKTSHNREDWDQALLSLPGAHILQTWDWGEFKSHWGWTAQRHLWLETDTPVAAAQILRRPIPHTPWSFLYVSKGPIFDYANGQLAQQVLADLESYARRARALFIKIDPDVIRQCGEPEPDSPVAAEGKIILDLLKQRGWRFSPEQIQFRNTVMVDLTPDTEAMLGAMKSKWRYNIRLAERKGVIVRPGTSADIPAFFEIYAQTAARDGFLIRPEAYYAELWQRFLEAGRAEIHLAEVGGDIVAGLVLFIFGHTAWYIYGASTDQHRKLMPNYLLQWTAICRAKERGCTCYDMWGAPDVFDESDRMWGVYRFKQGFGGQTIQGLGAYDYPVNRPLYWAFTVALPRLRSMMRRTRN